MFVSSLTSVHTGLHVEYYSLPFCKPGKKGLKHENIGEGVSGDKLENSVYKVNILYCMCVHSFTTAVVYFTHFILFATLYLTLSLNHLPIYNFFLQVAMKSEKSCEVACVRTLKKDGARKLIDGIDKDYRAHLILDNLPVGVHVEKEGKADEDYTLTRGYPIGFKHVEGAGKINRYVYNHLRIIVQYHDVVSEDNEIEFKAGQAKVVGFRVEPMSIHHKYSGDKFEFGQTVLDTCNDKVSPKQTSNNYQTVKKGEEIVYTYDVVWESSNIEWSNRWDIYILDSKSNNQVHWFSITNAIMIVLFLSVMIAMILLRTLKKDIANYNQRQDEEEAREESGWKLCHGDVFRPPSNFPLMLSVFIGTGVQLMCMCFATLSFTLLGLLSPENRGSLSTAFILLFVFMGSFAGYNSARTYKMFRGTDWKTCTIATAFFFPGFLSIVYFVLNFFMVMEGATGQVDIRTLCTLMFLWFCVSVPLVFLGSFFGYKQEAITHPVRTNQIPRQIPAQEWYINPLITIAFGGLLPFGAVAVELFFILSGLWLDQIYHIFGFLFLVMIVLVVTCAEVSILLCYFQLCNEDYHWWWRSFLTSGSCAFYIMLYSFWYYLTELEMNGFVPVLIYFSYMGILSLTFFLVTGCIGYFSCLWFTHKIYGSIKVD
jgi:transmembrane 9 superfamily protein 2/4